MAHPDAAAVPCATCAKWMFSPDWKPVMRGGVHQPRPAGTMTPCHSCPKKSPANAALLELTEPNLATLRLYLRSRATAGACLNDAEREDALLLRKLAICDVVFRQYEREQTSLGWLDAFALAKGK